MSRVSSMKPDPLDMDSLFDFNQSTIQPSPATAAASSQADALNSNNNNSNSNNPFDKQEERQHFKGPSHDYNQYKQQVGLPVGSMATVPMSQPPLFDGYSSGVGDMVLDGGFGGGGWSSGIDMDTEMAVDFNNPASAMPAMFFPAHADGAADAFVNPTTIAGGQAPPPPPHHQQQPPPQQPDERASKVGQLWPGMHRQQAQQAAMQKAAQAHAVQQRQLKLQAQHDQYRQVASKTAGAHGKRPSAAHAAEPHVEESISRLLSQMRQNGGVGADDDDAGSPSSGMLPHIARLKKDEEEMDADERLLNSDEGKKLSSKERRQLRNKVSARAFRSRRKEYISQLEGEIALKAQESNSLRQENTALVQENDRYRGLIEMLLRHPAFTPFIHDISQDPSLLGMPTQRPSMPAPPSQQPPQQPPQQQQQQQPQQQQPPPPSAQPTPQPPAPPHRQSEQQDVKPGFLNFDASQLQIPSQDAEAQSQSQSQPPPPPHVNMAMVPEENFSKLNIHGYQPNMDFNAFHTVNAYAVTDLPRPDLSALLATSATPGPALDRSTSTAASPAALNDSAVCMDELFAKLDSAARRLAAA